MRHCYSKPQYSLVEQSQHAQRSIYTVNGDGFGMGWYGSRPWPGVYHDTQPAWNDDNFQNLAAQVRSRMVLAHVRASSGTAIQRTNCHPFRHQHWLFQHNGEIGGFDKLKRDLQLAIAPELFPHLRGSTDSETMFYLAITYGVAEDPLRGCPTNGRHDRARPPCPSRQGRPVHDRGPNGRQTCHRGALFKRS